jgi:hypothetical protein
VPRTARTPARPPPCRSRRAPSSVSWPPRPVNSMFPFRAVVALRAPAVARRRRAKAGTGGGPACRPQKSRSVQCSRLPSTTSFSPFPFPLPIQGTSVGSARSACLHRPLPREISSGHHHHC